MKTLDIDELVQKGAAQAKKVPADQTLFCFGDECNYYVIVRSGIVRVDLLSKNGQQLLLYKIREGQSCVMTTSCLLGSSQYHAQAISETPVEIVLIPKKAFHTHLIESTEFREFVFNGFSERLAAMLERTAELATCSIDQRLSAALIAHAEDTTSDQLIRLTHEQLAIEIGSAREVVSRRLASFEKKNIIEKQRGYIRIVNHGKLAQLLAI